MKNKRRYVYCAGPIGQQKDRHRNVLAGIDEANAVLALGARPFLPHLSFYWDIIHIHNYEDWMDFDFDWITRCDAVYRFGGPSPGADREVAFARALGLPVFFSLDALQDWIDDPSTAPSMLKLVKRFITMEEVTP